MLDIKQQIWKVQRILCNMSRMKKNRETFKVLRKCEIEQDPGGVLGTKAFLAGRGALRITRGRAGT